MVDRTKGDKRIGVMACLCCTHEIPVKVKASGKLAAPCPWCDLPLYANENTEAFKLLMKRVKLDQAEDAGGGDQAAAASSSSSSAPASSSSSAPAARPAARPPLFGGGGR